MGAGLDPMTRTQLFKAMELTLTPIRGGVRRWTPPRSHGGSVASHTAVVNVLFAQGKAQT